MNTLSLKQFFMTRLIFKLLTILILFGFLMSQIILKDQMFMALLLLTGVYIVISVYSYQQFKKELNVFEVEYEKFPQKQMEQSVIDRHYKRLENSSALYIKQTNLLSMIFTFNLTVIYISQQNSLCDTWETKLTIF